MVATNGGADLAVVRSNFGHGAVAPAMADAAEFFFRSLEDVILLGRDVHFFRPEISAKMWVHGLI